MVHVKTAALPDVGLHALYATCALHEGEFLDDDLSEAFEKTYCMINLLQFP